MILLSFQTNNVDPDQSSLHILAALHYGITILFGFKSDFYSLPMFKHSGKIMIYSQTCVKRPYKTGHIFGFSDGCMVAFCGTFIQQ